MYLVKYSLNIFFYGAMRSRVGIKYFFLKLDCILFYFLLSAVFGLRSRRVIFLYCIRNEAICRIFSFLLVYSGNICYAVLAYIMRSVSICVTVDWKCIIHYIYEIIHICGMHKDLDYAHTFRRKQEAWE